MAKVANGSTLSFASANVGELADIGLKVGGAWVDVSDLADTVKKYEVGQDDIEVSATVVGESTIDRGDTGNVVIAWNSGGSDTLGSMVVGSKETSGAVDGRIETKLTLRPTN
jgi:hypothetical protein